MRTSTMARRVAASRGASSNRPFAARPWARVPSFPRALSPVPLWAEAGRSSCSTCVRPDSATASLVVALDLDECLVHSTNFCYGTRMTSPDAFRQHEQVRPEIVEAGGGVEKFELQMVGGTTCTVLKRRGVDEFLEACADSFETYVFTAGTQQYAEPLLDVLDPKKKLAGRLYRTECAPLRGLVGQQDQYLKDLSAVALRAGRSADDLARVVLVDNNPMSFICQPRNGVPVPHFLGAPDDVLPKVLQLLHRLSATPEDVRPKLHELFNLEAHVAALQQKMLNGRARPGESRL